MPTDMIDSGVGNATEAGLERLASLKWWGTVIAAVGGVVSMLAALGGILWLLAMAQAERANITETLASIKRTVEENKAAILVNTAELRAIRTTVEANSVDIEAARAKIVEKVQKATDGTLRG